MCEKNSSYKIKIIQDATVLFVVLTSTAVAQQAPNEITITAEPVVRLSGFEGVTQHMLPMETFEVDHQMLLDAGAQRITDALHLDASVSDSYNLPAYWDKLSVRGFMLDNRYNYRREGLPISAETIISMDNKERIELLKGTSGIQSGTSAPGGLVNYLVKRAPNSEEATIRDITLNYGPGNNRLTSADLGGRFGQDANFGYRFNVAHEELDPYIHNTTGHRELVALAMDWRVNMNNRLEWEFEQSHYEQIGVNFYSLLGQGTNALPAPVDGTRNITQQPSALPGIFDGLTGSVRLKHQLDNGWMWNTQFGSQNLRADDRLIYASGCASGPSDRFCSNGDFQIHDYRSENEYRTSEALQTELIGQAHIAGLVHSFKFGVTRQQLTNQLPITASDTLIGTTNAFHGGLTSLVGSTQYWSNTNIRDNNTEFSINDHIQITQQTSTWLGLRHTQLDRFSVQTDGSDAIHDVRNVDTPWLALSYNPSDHHTIYASYGFGLEVSSAPNSPNYVNKGQPLPALRSSQHEVGVKNQDEQVNWQIAWFDIVRPAVADSGINCSNNSASNTCTRQIDGDYHHQGLEINAQTMQRNQWRFGGSAMWLDAKRENATVQSNLNGQSPINVPSFIMRGRLEYHFASISGLRSGLQLSHEGERNVTETGDIKLPAWSTIDASTHYDTKVDHLASSWSLVINNVANKHYWRESPYQYNQYFLSPGAPRTVRATVVFHL